MVAMCIRQWCVLAILATLVTILSHDCHMISFPSDGNYAMCISYSEISIFKI